MLISTYACVLIHACMFMQEGDGGRASRQCTHSSTPSPMAQTEAGDHLPIVLFMCHSSYNMSLCVQAAATEEKASEKASEEKAGGDDEVRYVLLIYMCCSHMCCNGIE